VVAAGLPLLLREAVLWTALGLVQTRLLALLVPVDQLARCTPPLVALSLLVGALQGDESSGDLVSGVPCCAGLEPASASLEVADGRARIRIHGPAVLDLPAEAYEDERVAMVLSRLLCGEDGRCRVGQRVCTAERTWGDCDGASPTREVCDGLDNDCDGTPDDGLGDGDEDGFGRTCDNCPGLPNATQRDLDRDGTGDACDDDCPPEGWEGISFGDGSDGELPGPGGRLASHCACSSAWTGRVTQAAAWRPGFHPSKAAGGPEVHRGGPRNRTGQNPCGEALGA